MNRRKPQPHHYGRRRGGRICNRSRIRSHSRRQNRSTADHGRTEPDHSHSTPKHSRPRLTPTRKPKHSRRRLTPTPQPKRSRRPLGTPTPSGRSRGGSGPRYLQVKQGRRPLRTATPSGQSPGGSGPRHLATEARPATTMDAESATETEAAATADTRAKPETEAEPAPLPRQSVQPLRPPPLHWRTTNEPGTSAVATKAEPSAARQADADRSRNESTDKTQVTGPPRRAAVRRATLGVLLVTLLWTIVGVASSGHRGGCRPEGRPRDRHSAQSPWGTLHGGWASSSSEPSGSGPTQGESPG